MDISDKGVVEEDSLQAVIVHEQIGLVRVEERHVNGVKY